MSAIVTRACGCAVLLLLSAGCRSASGGLPSTAGGGSSGTPGTGALAGGRSAIFVANVRLANVMRFAANANGAVAPQLTVQGGLVPNAMAFDSAGNLYVSGNNNAVNVYKPFASQPFQTIVNGQICRLAGIAVDPFGALYASDPVCDQIVKLVPQSNGAYALAWFIQGSRTKLSGPSSVAVDTSGHVFALDQPNATNSSPPAVTEYDPSGASGQSDLAPITTITGGSFPTDVRGMGADAASDVFIASASQIQEYAGTAGAYRLAGSITGADLCGIESLTTGTIAGKQYVLNANSCGPASAGNGTLTLFDVTTPLSGPQTPSPILIAGSATQMDVSTGSAVAFDSSGNSGSSAFVGNPLLDTVTGYCECSSSAPPQYQLSLGYPGLDGVQTIWFGRSQMYSSDAGTPAISLYGEFPISAPSPLMPAPLWRILGSNTRLCGPASVIADTAANVYVSNDCSTNGGGANSNTVERFNAPPPSSSGNLNLAPVWITAAGPCPNVPTASVLCNPQQLAIDALGNVYVTNYGGNSIIEYSPGGSTVAVMTSDPSLLHRPSGIAFDPAGEILVYSDAESDAAGNYPGLVAYFAPPSGSGNVTLKALKTIAGNGTTLASAQFGQIAVDGQGNLFVDLFKSIVVYGPNAASGDSPLANIALPAGAGGTGLAIAPPP